MRPLFLVKKYILCSFWMFLLGAHRTSHTKYQKNFSDHLWKKSLTFSNENHVVWTRAHLGSFSCNVTVLYNSIPATSHLHRKLCAVSLQINSLWVLASYVTLPLCSKKGFLNIFWSRNSWVQAETLGHPQALIQICLLLKNEKVLSQYELIFLSWYWFEPASWATSLTHPASSTS